MGRSPLIPARHHIAIDQALLEAAAGKIQLLFLQIPVQHGKTTYASVYHTAWQLGTWPEKNVVAISYNDDTVADKIGAPARGVMERCAPEVFGVAVDPRSKARTRWDIHGRGGGFFAGTVNKGVAARRIDVGIIDDPVGSRADIDSPRKRRRQHEWYREEYSTRLAPDSLTVMIMSRWDVDDLVGLVLMDAIDQKIPFRFLDLPAIAMGVDSESTVSYYTRRVARAASVPESRPVALVDELGRKAGEALWPEVRPILFLEKQLRAVGLRQFNGQFQGRPDEEKGSFFKRDWFRYYGIEEGSYGALDFVFDDELPGGQTVRRTIALDRCRIMQYVDLATSEREEADYFVITTVAIDPSPSMRIFVVNVLRVHAPGPQHTPLLWKEYRDFRPVKQKIEAVGFQSSVVQSAVAEGLPAFPIVRPKGDKKTRATYAATRMEQGMILFPHRAPWLGEFEEELLKFTGAPGGKDDQVDTLADAANDLLIEDYDLDGGPAGAVVDAR